MTSTKRSKERIDYSHQVWDSSPHKLLLYVIDAKDVAAKDSNGKSDPYVVIEHGKYKKQTKIIEKTLNPVWNELFFIQAEPAKQVKLEMWDYDKIGSPDYLGHVILDLQVIPQDRIVDVYPPLLARKKKEHVSGSIHVRVYHSSARETRSASGAHGAQFPDMVKDQFLYRPYKNAFKPGDLIGYSGYGIISGIQKIFSCNPITSVGMVVYLPNKWTSDVEPYVIEMTRNINRNIDSFSETNTRSGIYIFRLFERFHQFHGSDLVHFPLLHPLPSDMYKKLVEKVWEYHKKNAYLDDTREAYHYGPYFPLLNAFVRKKKHWNFDKNERMVEATSFDFVVRILKECGALQNDFQDPADILRSNLYGPPVQIRQSPTLYFYGNPVAAPVPVNQGNEAKQKMNNNDGSVCQLDFTSLDNPHAPPQMPQLPSYNTLPTYTPSQSYANFHTSFPHTPLPPHASSTGPPPVTSQARSLPAKSVSLSQLEMDTLMGLLDGVVVDDHLTVTKDEFRHQLVAKGITVFEDEAKFESFYNVLDSDNDGKVELRELVCGLAIFVDGSMDEKLVSAFKVFDRDGDRFIKKSELRTLLSTLLKAANRGGGPSPPKRRSFIVEDFVTQIFAEYDKNNDGKLSLDEFMNAAHTNSAVGNLFLTVSNLA